MIGFLIKSEFISDSQPGYGNTWTLRVTAEPLRKMQRSFLSVIIYVYNEGSGQMDMNGNINKGMVEEIFGHTQEVQCIIILIIIIIIIVDSETSLTWSPIFWETCIFKTLTLLLPFNIFH